MARSARLDTGPPTGVGADLAPGNRRAHRVLAGSGPVHAFHAVLRDG